MEFYEIQREHKLKTLPVLKGKRGRSSGQVSKYRSYSAKKLKTADLKGVKVDTSTIYAAGAAHKKHPFTLTVTQKGSE